MNHVKRVVLNSEANQDTFHFTFRSTVRPPNLKREMRDLMRVL
jgi:hypothetical protein